MEEHINFEAAYDPEMYSRALDHVAVYLGDVVDAVWGVSEADLLAMSDEDLQRLAVGFFVITSRAPQRASYHLHVYRLLQAFLDEARTGTPGEIHDALVEHSKRAYIKTLQEWLNLDQVRGSTRVDGGAMAGECSRYVAMMQAQNSTDEMLTGGTLNREALHWWLVTVPESTAPHLGGDELQVFRKALWDYASANTGEPQATLWGVLGADERR